MGTASHIEIYDDEGTRTKYTLETNIQGDVIAIYSDTGTKIAEYRYDAWGKCTVLNPDGTENVNSSFIGNINPFRYRGYYYDKETKLYYLNSRYYDPQVKRFINADSMLPGVSGNTDGYNLYSYCFNNPVNMSDPDGNWPQWIEDARNWVEEKINQVKTFFETEISKIQEDIANYNWNNTSEEVVLKSNYFSAYKETLVIRLPTDASASFGILFIEMGETDVRTVQHEYGHKVQLETMNFVDYMLNVSLPSITINLLYRLDKLPYDYYDAPWEKQADELGGVTNREIVNPWPKSGHNTFFELIPLFFN